MQPTLHGVHGTYNADRREGPTWDPTCFIQAHKTWTPRMSPDRMGFTPIQMDWRVELKSYKIKPYKIIKIEGHGSTGLENLMDLKFTHG